MNHIHKKGVVILDFGSQYTQLIARRVREHNVYSKIVAPGTTLDEILNHDPAAIILSGGPSSIYEKNAPGFDFNIINSYGNVEHEVIMGNFNHLAPSSTICGRSELRDGIFIGASQTKEIRNAMIVSVLGYIGVSILLTRYLGNHGIWFSLLLFMMFRAATLQFYFKNILKKF